MVGPGVTIVHIRRKAMASYRELRRRALVLAMEERDIIEIFTILEAEYEDSFEKREYQEVAEKAQFFVYFLDI